MKKEQNNSSYDRTIEFAKQEEKLWLLEPTKYELT